MQSLPGEILKFIKDLNNAEALQSLQETLQIHKTFSHLFTHEVFFNVVCLLQDFFDRSPVGHPGGSVVHFGSTEDHHGDVCRSVRLCMLLC